ncbi:MAG TPA: phosphatase PAP2 family protein, partial [Chryseolinea sp.]|nr:phosphatase PAP2 family protein [Chryseolinea sp.]
DANFSEVRAARAFALLNMTMHNASIACWDTKFFYFNARPSQLIPAIKTSTGVPNFPAYVSGHSTYSASAATMLSYLFPAYASDFQTMATEAAMSRLYGGIHYRKDSEVGLTLGTDVGEHLVNTFAKVDGAD